jgi:hypothetical protein
MKQRAISHGMKPAGRLALHKEIPSATEGTTRQHMEIFSFHAPTNWDFAAYMPYRIALYRDKEERAWLATVDLGLLIHGVQELEPKLKLQMIATRDRLLDIMAAGASGSAK